MNKKTLAMAICLAYFAVLRGQSIDTTSRNTGIPNFGRTILLADSVARTRIADSAFVKMATPQNITGVKNFVPVITASGGYARGMSITPTLTANASGDMLTSLYVGAPVVTNLSSFPSLGVYAAIFTGSVKAPILAATIRTNSIIRDVSIQPMSVLKPSCNADHLLVFDGRQDTTQATSNIVSSNLFRDSMRFRSNTTAEGFTQLLVRPVFGQTGYSGTTRGIYVNPSLTDVVDFRAVQTNVANGTGYQLYAAGTAPSVFLGRVFVGDTSSSVANLVINTNRPGNSTGQLSVGKKSGAGAMTFVNVDGNGFGTVGYKNGTVSGDFVIGSAGGAGSLSFVTGGTEKLRILNNGNIGIGTASPQTALAVNGDITAKRIKVTTTGWADYVFDSSYQLLPLGKVEKYIQQNGHLPHIPSAAVVKEKGIELGENQVLLLGKIEELTLYIIDQEKQLQEQKKKAEQQCEVNRNLEQKLADIEKRLFLLESRK